MRHSITRIVPFLLILLCGLMPAVLCAEPITSVIGGEMTLADVLPPETICFFRRPAVKVQQAGYQQSVLRKIAANLEMSRFLRAWEVTQRKYVNDVAAKANLDPAFVQSIMDGRISGALVDMGMITSKSGKTELGYTLVLAVRLEQKPDRKKLFGAIRAMVDRWQEQQGRKQKIPLSKVAWEEKYPGGHKVMMIVGANPLRFVLLGKTLLFYRGPRSEGLKRILANFDNPLTARVLSKSQLYRAAYGGAEAGRDMGFLYVNTVKLHSLLGAVGMPKVTRLLDVLGIRGVMALGCAGGYFGGGLRHTLYLHAPRERRGIIKSLSMKPKAEAAAMMLPGDAPGILAARANLGSLYNEIPLLVDAVEHALGRATPLGLANLAGQQTILGVPAQTILSTLGDAVIVQPGPAGWVLRFDNANYAAFTAAVVRMQKNAGVRFSGQALRLGANQVFNVYYFNRSGKPLPVAPSFCIAQKHANGTGVIYIAAYPQAIKAVLRHKCAGMLQGAPDYQRVSAGMGKGYGVFLYVNNRDSYPRVFDNLLLPILNAWRSVSATAPDPGLLPCGRDIAPHLFGCGVGIKNQPQGITFTAYSPMGFGGFAVFLLDKLVVSNPTAIGMIAAKVAGYLDSGQSPSRLNAGEGPDLPVGPKSDKKATLPGGGQ